MPFASPANLNIHDFPHIFEHFVSPSGFRFRSSEPRVDVLEDSHKTTFILNLPGVPLSEVDITVNDGLLGVSGTWGTSYDQDVGVKVEVEERAKGKFQRVFRVPRSLAAKDIKATMADGVLKIEFESAKANGKEGEKVVISAGGGGYC